MDISEIIDLLPSSLLEDEYFKNIREIILKNFRNLDKQLIY